MNARKFTPLDTLRTMMALRVSAWSPGGDVANTFGDAILQLADRLDRLEAERAVPRDPDSEAQFRGLFWGDLCVGTVDPIEVDPDDDNAFAVALWPSGNGDATRWLDRAQTEALRDWLTEQLEAER